MVKAVLIDFDGTLVTKDMLSVVCGIVGREEESDRLNKDFFAGKLKGLSALIQRINFLKGVSLRQIQEKLDQDAYLAPGAKEFVDFLNHEGIISVLNSGNILPVLTYYQKMLGITHIVGTHPKMDGDVIVGISEEDFSEANFKVAGVKKILEVLRITGEEALAIGDSPADKAMFEFAGTSIAFNPKSGIEEYADYVIADSLANAIPIIRSLNRKS
ncbi:MAG: HAD-IB family phosphatase [Candidatus Liptonbacteria bacterium]|nr:HAD-IB family phosphatase [Candidatus Liptonbacteria bacterium]